MAAPLPQPIAAAQPAAGPIGARQKRLNKVRDAMAANTKVPTDGVAWGAAAHATACTRTLTERDPRAPTPPGFKGRLYEPQATMLHAMLEFEKNPLLRIEDPVPGAGNAAVFAARHAPVLQTARGLVSEELGFGKTILVLALTCAARRPRAVPMQLNLCAPTACPPGLPALGSFHPELTVRYPRVLPVTVVAAAAGVITQWITATTRFTSLKFMTVENVYSLKAFEAAYAKDGLAGIDLLFIKVGRVTANYVAPGEAKMPSKRSVGQRSLIGAVGAIVTGAYGPSNVATFARMVVDDFDTIKLMSDDNFLPALFTWLVSGTHRGTTMTPNRGDTATAESFLRESAKFPILATAADGIVFGPLSLHCDPAYVAKFISTTTIAFRRVHVAGGRAAQLLRQLGVADDVVEMVNADAIGTAADALGINARSTKDLIAWALKDRCDKYRRALLVLARVDEAREATYGTAGAELTKEAVIALRVELKSCETPVADLVEGTAFSDGLRLMFSSLEDWAEGERRTYGGALQRMRDNIREQRCQCCQLPLTGDEDSKDAKTTKMDENAYILNCCQIVVCEPCIVTVDGDVRRFITSCPNCARDVNAKKDLIRVGKELDLTEALDDRAINDTSTDVSASTLRYCLIDALADALADARSARIVTREAALAVAADACNVDTWACVFEAADVAGAHVSFAAAGVDAKYGDAKSANLDMKHNPDAKHSHMFVVDSVPEELDFSAVNRVVRAATAVAGRFAITIDKSVATAAPKVNAVDEKDERKAGLESIDKPGLRALVQILRGQEPECKRVEDDVVQDMGGLLAGRRDAPWPADRPKKYLVFTMFAESTRHVAEALTLVGLKHVTLRGTRSQKDAALATFQSSDAKKGCNIMLVTSARDCAGVCMPYVAVGVEYHHVADPAVRAQLRARYHRPLRDFSSLCITIVNDADAV